MRLGSITLEIDDRHSSFEPHGLVDPPADGR
jgi:hypothetical protein